MRTARENPPPARLTLPALLDMRGMLVSLYGYACRHGHSAAIGILLLAGAVGVWVSPHQAASAFRFVIFLLGILIYVVVVKFTTSLRRFWLGLGCLAVAGLAVALLSLVGSKWMDHKFPLLSGAVNWMPQLPNAWLIWLGARDRIHPNEASGVLILVLPPLVGLWLWLVQRDYNTRYDASGVRPSQHFLPRALLWLTLAATIVISLYLGLSLARGALVALFISLLWLLFQRGRWLGFTALLVSLTAIAGALLLLPPTTIQALTSSDLLTPQWYPTPTRFEIWREGWGLLQASPWTGIGLSAFYDIFRDMHPWLKTAMIYGVPEVPHAHNIYLQAGLDLGVFGAVAYLALLVHAALAAFRAGRRCGTGPAAGAAYGLTAGLLAFSLYGLFDAITVASRPIAVIWLVAGLGVAIERVTVQPGWACFRKAGVEITGDGS
ncbi:MAG: O-antigen ligase domain-containing protein [Chloroflexi bacterium]|nr:O-antigen ligase domain-containing protein [Chloroflexota bacterium]